MNDYAAFYRQIAEMEREATRGQRRQRRSGAAWERTPEATQPSRLVIPTADEARQLEIENQAEAEAARARSDYSPLPDEAGLLVPIAAMAGDLLQAPVDAAAASAGNPEAQRRLGERDRRWARGMEQAGEDILAEGHGGQFIDWLSGLPDDLQEAERARLEAGGENSSSARMMSALGGLWTGMAAAPREARGRMAAEDVRQAQAGREWEIENARGTEAFNRSDFQAAGEADIAARLSARTGRQAEARGDIAAGEDFWYNAPWAVEFFPEFGMVQSLARFPARRLGAALGQDVSAGPLARPNYLSETQRPGVRTGESRQLRSGDVEDVLYSATGNARGWRNNAALGGAAYLGADAIDGEMGDDPTQNAMIAGGAMAYGRRFIPNIDSAIPDDIQHLMRQGEIGPDGARNYTPRPRQRLTVDPEGRVAMDYEGSFNTGDGATIGETRSVMRGAREALDQDIAATRRSEYSWTPNDERQAALYRSTFERDTPTNYAFSETPQGEMRLRRLGAEFEPDPIQAERVADDAPFGFEGATSAGRIIDAEATPAPQRRFEAAVRDPETGQVYRGEDHQQAIDSAPDEAVRARLQAAYDAADEDPSVIGFQVDGQFMGREDGLAALRERAGRGRQVRIGEQVNADGTVSPRSEIDWENGSNRLPADDEWFNNLAGVETPTRRLGRDRPQGSITSDPNGTPLQGLDTTPSVSDPVEMRMERARRMGFDTETPLYVSSLEDLRAFDEHGNFYGNSGLGGIHLTDNPEMASRYLDRYGNIRYDGAEFQKNVMPVFIRRGTTREINGRVYDGPQAVQGFPLPENYAWPRNLDGVDTVIRRDSISSTGDVQHATPEDFDLLRELDPDPTYRGAPIQGREFILRDPSRVRSIFAAFDPARSSSSDLLAGVTAGGVIGGGVGSLMEGDAEASDGSEGGIDWTLPILGGLAGAASLPIANRLLRNGSRDIGYVANDVGAARRLDAPSAAPETAVPRVDSDPAAYLGSNADEVYDRAWDALGAMDSRRVREMAEQLGISPHDDIHTVRGNVAARMAQDHPTGLVSNNNMEGWEDAISEVSRGRPFDDNEILVGLDEAENIEFSRPPATDLARSRWRLDPDDPVVRAVTGGVIGAGGAAALWPDNAMASDGSDENGVPMLPVLGTATGAATWAALRGRRLGQANRSQVGMFAGVNARTADRAALERAQQMAASGASRDDIWRDTGWFQGVDGKWRFEIDDSGATIAPDMLERHSAASVGSSQRRPLTEGMQHDELYDAYNLDDTTLDFSRLSRGALGEYDHSRRTIGMLAADDPDMLRSGTLHETQHRLQREESFAGGGMPENMLQDELAAINNRLSRIVTEQDHWRSYARNGPQFKAEADQNLATLRAEYDGLLERRSREINPQTQRDAYNRLAGETEARNVQTRRDFTPEERRARPPWETQDVPDDQQIVRFDGDVAQSRRLGQPSRFDSAVNPERGPVSGGQTGTEAVPDLPPLEQTRTNVPRGAPAGARAYLDQRNARILELIEEMQPVRNARSGAANPNARIGERLDNGYRAIAERLREEGYGEVTHNVIKGVVNRNRGRAQTATAEAASAGADEAAAQRLGMSVERYRALSARKRNEAIAAIGVTGAGGLLLANDAEAEEEIGLPELADPTLEGAEAQGGRQTLDLGDGRLEHRQIWRLSDGSYALRVTIQDVASQNQVGAHRWYEWAAGEPLSVGGEGQAPGRLDQESGRPAAEGNNWAGFAGVPAGIAAGAAISRRRPILGSVAGSSVGLATASALGANDEQALWSTVLPAALGPLTRHVGDYGIDTLRASLPEGRARIGQFAATLPDDEIVTRGQQILSDDYLGNRQMVDLDTGAFDVPMLDAAAPRRMRVAGDEIAEQGYSRPLEALPSLRERFGALRPAERLRMAEAAEATEQLRLARIGEARQASTSARLDRAASEWGELPELPPAQTANAAPKPPPASERAFWFDPYTGEPVFGGNPGRRPPPRQERRPMADLGQSSQQRRLGEAEGGTGAQAARSVAERELGQTFKTGAAAMRALRERMMSDPAFAEKMNRLYPAIVAAVLGGGFAGEMQQRLN